MKRYRFSAAIQRSTGWGAFVFFPHSVQEEFNTRARVPVQALLGGLPYTGSLMPDASGYHRLAVPQSIYTQLGLAPGDTLSIILWKDEAPRTVDLPEDFIRLLRKEKLLAAFESLSLTRRKEYRNWVASAKQAPTQQRRMQKAIAILRSETTSRN